MLTSVETSLVVMIVLIKMKLSRKLYVPFFSLLALVVTKLRLDCHIFICWPIGFVPLLITCKFSFLITNSTRCKNETRLIKVKKHSPPQFHYTANATTTTQKQRDYKVEQSSFTLIALFSLKTGRCPGRNWLNGNQA